jgi:5-formyltetrahydrofolate cyclo-ligase
MKWARPMQIPPPTVKIAARAAALASRARAHGAESGGGAGAGAAAAAHLAALLAALAAEGRARVIAGYMPIRTEIDPIPAMIALAATGARMCVPVVDGAGLPLSFRAWAPGCAMIPGAFGAPIPADAAPLAPDALIVPLLAFDAAGGRLGYGGGFYDRTLARLRAGGPVVAIGFAYGAQQVDATPQEATDQPLDFIVTEAGARRI